MPSVCRDCRDPVRAQRERDEYARWWLARFSDEALAAMTREVFGVGDAVVVRSIRERLMGPDQCAGILEVSASDSGD